MEALHDIALSIALIISLPALDHDIVYSTGAARGRGQTVALVYQTHHLFRYRHKSEINLMFTQAYLYVGVVLKRFKTKTPYLVHENSITPHITSTGVLLVVESLYRYTLVYNYYSGIPFMSVDRVNHILYTPLSLY